MNVSGTKANPDWIAADWGSTSLRVWAIASDGTVIDHAASDKGMGQITKSDYEPALLELVGSWLEGLAGPVPVIICGMAGARQGWKEAAYRRVPCAPVAGDALTEVETSDPRLSVRIVPGLSQSHPQDVIRGEETQLAGFLGETGLDDAVICLPGTHSKWVSLEGGDVSQLGETSTLGGEAAAAPAPAQPSTPDSGGTELAIGEQADYDAAQAALGEARYRDAADGFARFITNYPGSPLAARAQLGRGKALTGLEDTREAARAYLASFSADPTGPVAAESLVLLGAALGKLGQVNQACLTLAEVSTRFPMSDASPVVVGETAYFVGINAHAYALPDRAEDRLELVERWSAKPKGSRFYASPVVCDGLIYAVSTQHVLTVMEAETGEQVYARRLKLGRGPVWASLCVAGDQLYVSSRDGVTVVLATGREFQELARNRLEYFISTPVFDRDRMYVRTSDFVYCIGGP